MSARRVSRREQRDRIASERHREERIRKGACAPGYDGPCMGPTHADYKWADRQMAAVFGAVGTGIEEAT